MIAWCVKRKLASKQLLVYVGTAIKFKDFLSSVFCIYFPQFSLIVLIFHASIVQSSDVSYVICQSGCASRNTVGYVDWLMYGVFMGLAERFVTRGWCSLESDNGVVKGVGVGCFCGGSSEEERQRCLNELGGERRDLFGYACSCYMTHQVINQGEVLVLWCTRPEADHPRNHH